MRFKTIVAVAVAVYVLVGGASAQHEGSRVSSAQAQDAKSPLEKGVTTKNLVTSLGAFRGTGNIPIVVTGQIVAIEVGGQTGRQRFLVPAYIYVLEGVLTTDSEGGPVGVAGAQYHAAGQSYMDAVGVWHSYSNGGSTPVKYLLLFIGTPGSATTEVPQE